MSPVAGALTFIVVVLLGLVLYMPAYKEYFHTYDLRVRPRKKAEELTGEVQKDSAILAACRSVGEASLSVFPGLADKRTTELLIYGGYRTPQHMATYIGVKVTVVSLLSLFSLIASGGNVVQLLLAIPMGVVAWIMPNFILAGRVKKRQYALVMELPTVVDLMIVCAQAGLGMLMCIDKVSKEVGDSCPVLSFELQQLIQDVKVFAKSSQNALKDMADRCGVEELTGVCSSLIAAEAKGSDISYPLRQQSEAIRDRIKRKKEEEASKTPVKMVPVIMIFIMPLILIPMLGPAVVTIMQAFGPALSGK